MQIFKKINNNVALARDAKGRELVVFGKGIGFPAMPYELNDLSSVQRTFYDVNEKYFELLREIPGEVFLVADDIAANAQDELDCSLSPNLTYALADHLNFAIQRCRTALSSRHRLPMISGTCTRRNTALQSRPCTSSGILCTLSCPTRKL